MTNTLKKVLYFFALILMISCSTNEKLLPAEDALDAVRLFKDAYQNGNFEKAKFYCVDDVANNVKLNSIFKAYQQKSNAKKAELKSASIIILKNEIINEQNAQIIVAPNDTFNVVKNNNVWLIKL